MPLSLDPEYHKAVEPLLTAFENAPKLPIGDIQGRRTALDNLIGGLVAQIPEATNVKEEVYHVKSQDGFEMSLYHYVRQDGDTSRSALEPAVYYLHGGGYICMDVAMYRSRLKNLVAETGVQFFAAEYRPSPEVRYPKALEDAWAGLIHADIPC